VACGRRGFLSRPHRVADHRVQRRSGYDLYARLLARHIGKHIPGRPAVVAQNMPGAGSLKAANYVFSVAPKDGSVIGTMSRSLPVEPLLGDLQLEARKFTWLGSIASTTSLCAAWHTTGSRPGRRARQALHAGRRRDGADLDNFRGDPAHHVRRQGQAGDRLSGRLGGQSRDRGAARSTAAAAGHGTASRAPPGLAA